jgi:hypothetical protein
MSSCETSFEHNEVPERLVTFDDDAERMRALATLHLLLVKAMELDGMLGDEVGNHALHRKFVHKSSGSTKYPFEHFRVAARSKSAGHPDIRVAAVRFPVTRDAGGKLHVLDEQVFLAWDRVGNEEAFSLNRGAFSKLEVTDAFGIDSPLPHPESLAELDDIDVANIYLVLEGFEPDLHPSTTDISA